LRIAGVELQGLAETARFELAVAVTRHDGLANRWFQPLTHVSGWRQVRGYNRQARRIQPACADGPIIGLSQIGLGSPRGSLQRQLRSILSTKQARAALCEGVRHAQIICERVDCGVRTGRG
jgi:hypothetical protein